VLGLKVPGVNNIRLRKSKVIASQILRNTSGSGEEMNFDTNSNPTSFFSLEEDFNNSRH